MIDSQTQNFVAVMLAFLANKPVEYRKKGCKHWLTTEVPSWNWVEMEYRIKPEVLKYRRALCRDGSTLYVSNCYDEHDVQFDEKRPHFIRWIDDNWIEVSA